jgi:ADP-ribosyl-[dinitrogen reductase] hydrolase
MIDINIQNSYRGSFVGLAIGDTLGMAVEFEIRGNFEPLTKPEAGGPFDLPLGHWTDDTSMALCLADSLIEQNGYNSYDVMNKYTAWRDDGYRSSIGVCFDIGNQVNTAINEFNQIGSAIVPVNKNRLSSAGNGSIMRLAPIVIASHAAGNTLEKTMEMARISGRETHYSDIAEEGTALFGAMLFNAFERKSKDDLVGIGGYANNEALDEILEAIKTAPDKTVEELNPSGYIINSLVCAMWAFVSHDTFEDGALAAVNLGGDADTIGAIYGQLAGAFYGYNAIPTEWRSILHMGKDIVELSDALGELTTCSVLRTRFKEDGEQYAAKLAMETVLGDITKLKVDAIVNAANTSLFGGSGECGAIFDAAGCDDMTAACQSIGKCEYGDAVITEGFNLPAKWVIHTVGPIYGQHNGAEPDILQSCYWQSLRVAEDRYLRSIAFPLISTGVYGYPKEEAVKIAIASIKDFFEDNPQTLLERVVLCAYSKDDNEIIVSKI